MIFNLHSEWLPLKLEDINEVEEIAKINNSYSISQLQNLVSQSNLLNFQFNFSVNVTKALPQLKNSPVELVFVVPRSAVVGIIDIIRNMILGWAVNLEDQGVIGKRINFTKTVDISHSL